MAAFQEVLNRMLGIQTNAQQNLPVMPNNGNPGGANNMPAMTTGGNAQVTPVQTGGANQPDWMRSRRMDDIWEHLLRRRRGGGEARPGMSFGTGGNMPSQQAIPMPKPVVDPASVATPMPKPMIGDTGGAIPMPKPVLRPEDIEREQRMMERPDRPILPNRYFRDYER